MALRSVTAVNVFGRRENEIVQQWMTRFTPMLRYGNPALLCEFRPIKLVQQAVGNEASQPPPAADTVEGPEESGAQVGPQDGAVETSDTAAAEAEEKERIELQFTDGTSHVMNLSLYRWSHQIMQRIVELDTEKGLSAV
eukprot:CAMPEP_0171269146 /NCGR_PEP_ID=MMETSP0790-20130122/60041_1 /TAXON_ID=2925 /ORGANISM="Alexandrium catenella, Strain OF101" /LENGTH=138 /DNA_ID=CAMNT_0011737939 /DNA_START=53 /DNA_END=469 /DNA_ORIENTATION=+